MTKFLFVTFAVLVSASPGVAVAQTRKEGQRQAKQILWAAMSVQQPVFAKTRTNELTITFAVVNDGDSTVNPGIASSHLFINGVELKEWAFISSNGPSTSFHTALPPKRALLFTCGCGQYFSKPGVYTLRWQGESFKASDITFRVLPGDL
jgi:hypothetical protein